VRVLLDSSSEGNLIFVDKTKPMLLPSSKRLVPQLWNTLNGMFQTKHKAEIELSFFEYSDSKRYLAEPDIVEYDKNNKPQYDLILGVQTMKKYGIILDFKDKMITVDEVKLPMQNINYPWQLWDAGLKVNAEKLTFCALEIEYLGYVLTRDGI
jgi:hypothetical protein